MATSIPDKTYFKIGEAAQLVGVEPHTIRYWEKEFRAIRPAKTKSRQRLFRQKDVQLLLVIRDLLHEKRFTIDGARQKLKELSEAGMTTEAMLDAIEAGRPLERKVQDEAERADELASELERLRATVAAQAERISSLQSANVDDMNAKLLQSEATETALRDTVHALRGEIERLRTRIRDVEHNAEELRMSADTEADGLDELRDEMTRRWQAALATVRARPSRDV